MKYLMLCLVSTLLACSSDTSTLEASVAGECLPASAKSRPLTLCPLLNCGDNAPNAGDGLLFDELDLFGRSNYAGVKLHPRYGWTGTGRPLSATWSGGPAWIDIERDELVVHDYPMGRAHRGRALIGTVIQLSYTPTAGMGETDEIFELRVACYEDGVQPFLAPTPPIPPTPPTEFVRVYDFQARRGGPNNQNQQWFEVCNQDPLLDDPGWTGPAFHALLYRGDRYNRQKQVVANDPTDGWSFIACNGSAGSKMHLHRHTYAGSFDTSGAPRPEWMTTLAQRTTLLKAITADYCGDGRSDFTMHGRHLAFATSLNPDWFFRVWRSGVTSFEAIWRVDDTVDGPVGGAVCLDEPRLQPPWTRAYVVANPGTGCQRSFDPCYPGTGTPPDIPPDMMTLPAGWDSRGYVITGNPQPLP